MLIFRLARSRTYVCFTCLQHGLDDKGFNIVLAAIGVILLITVVLNLMTLLRGARDVVMSPQRRIKRIEARHKRQDDGDEQNNTNSSEHDVETSVIQAMLQTVKTGFDCELDKKISIKT